VLLSAGGGDHRRGSISGRKKQRQAYQRIGEKRRISEKKSMKRRGA
jgi:hypothetical protein